MKLTIIHNSSIKKSSLLYGLTLFIFVMPFFLAFLQDFLKVPGLVKYTIDVAWIAVVAISWFRQKIYLDKKLIPFIIFIGIFLTYTLLIYIFNYQSVVYYLWGFRNNFRFYFAFIAFSMFFTENEATSCLKFMDVLFWINAVVMAYQFFVLNLTQDYLGGIFGTERGCNAYMIIFFCIVISKSILNTMSKQESVALCFFKCAIVLVASAAAELKFFYVLFLLIVFMSIIFTSFSWRKMVLLLSCTILLSFAGTLITGLFGQGDAITFENLLEIATAQTYSSEQDLSRFTALPTISRTILVDTPDRIFGLGLGNCDTSTFDICNTPFFQAYSELHYIWFSSAFLFLETGYIGLTMYLSFFVLCFLCAYKTAKSEDANKIYCQISMITSVICVLMTFYNSSLRTEVAYIAFFALALPLICTKKDLNYKRKVYIHR